MPKGRGRRGRGTNPSAQEINCPVCQVSVNVGQVILCDTCNTWYHLPCVEVSHSDSCVLNRDECYSCPRCRRRANNIDIEEDLSATVNNNINTETGIESSQDIRSDDRFDLTPFLDPVIPGPSLDIPEDLDGWSSIDGWGVWDCASTITSPLEEVPGVFRNSWSNALSAVLRKVQQAGSQEETTRALKWLLAIPKLLLREPRRGGRKGQGTGELSARFEAVRTENWGLLLVFLKKDEECERKRRHNRGTADIPSNPLQEKAKTRKTVLSLISRGHVGKARRRIISHGVASMSNPAVMSAMQAKYPPRSHDMPRSVHRGTCMDSLPCLKETLLNLDSGVAAGFGGLRNEHLRCAAQHWDENDISVLEDFCLKYLNGSLPPWFYKVWESQSTVPLFKRADQNPNQIRPVGIKSSFVRVLHKEVVKDNRGALRDYLEPQQLALAPGGAAKLVHCVRMTLEENPNFVCVCLDMKNAHNEVSRTSVVAGLESQLTLRHLAQHAATCLAAHHRLEAGGEAWGDAGQGLAQGDPEAGFMYCVACHEEVKSLDRDLAAAGGKGRCQKHPEGGVQIFWGGQFILVKTGGGPLVPTRT